MLPKRFNALQEGLFLDVYKTVLHAYIYQAVRIKHTLT